MNKDLDHAIENLMGLMNAFLKQGDGRNAQRTAAELLAWQEVKDGLPFNDSPFHHAELRYIYRASRATALNMKGASCTEKM